MTKEEFLAHVERIWDALPENRDDALCALGSVCNTLVRLAEQDEPGYAMSWMATLQSVFDKNGIQT